MEYEQPRELLKLIESLNVDTDGRVIRGTLDNTLLTVSGYFTPQGQVSKLASIVHDSIETGDVFTGLLGQVGESSLMALIKNTNLKYEQPHLYQMMQVIVTESFSLAYAIENQEELTYYYNQQDASRLHENINYVIDILGQLDKTDYYALIQDLRNLDVDTMYMYSTLNTTSLEGSATNNNLGHNNLVLDSDFEDAMHSWDITGASYEIEDRVLRKRDLSGKLMATSSLVTVSPRSYLSFVARTTGKVEILATDASGNPLESFVDYWGNTITTGILAESNETINDEKSSHQVTVPDDVRYVRLRVTMDAEEGEPDYLTEPMLVVGGVIGNYVKG